MKMVGARSSSTRKQWAIWRQIRWSEHAGDILDPWGLVGIGGGAVGQAEGTKVGVGLCASCRFMRVMKSDRGSTFHMCQLSATDPAFPKYPRLPVLRCVGYEEEKGEDAIKLPKSPNGGENRGTPE